MEGCIEGCCRGLLSREPITHGPTLEVVDSGSATIWVRGSAVGAACIKNWAVGSNEETPSVAYAQLDKDADFTGRARLVQLLAGRQYKLSVETAAPDSLRLGQFRTPPANNDDKGGACSFVFGSCVGGQGYGPRAGGGAESGFPAFTAMQAMDPSKVVHVPYRGSNLTRVLKALTLTLTLTLWLGLWLG